MFARIALALPLGAAVTAGLLFMMQMLVATGHGQSSVTSHRAVDFVRVERSETVEVRQQRPEKPEPREPAPDIVEPDLSQTFPSTLGIAVAKPNLEFGAEIGHIGDIASTPSDGEYLPVIKVSPAYPMRALQRKLEGYVVVEFIVTSSGAVRDVVVVESSSPIFEQAAVEAALKFKYKPRVIDGTAIEVAGVQNRITFKLDA